MALLFASERWGNGEWIYNYKAEAQKILDAMLSKTESSDSRNVVTNIFNKKEKQVVFVPSGEADDFTDPSAVHTFGHLSATIALSRKRASEGLYPAIDLLQSGS